MLDAVTDQIRGLKRGLGPRDAQKLDDYLDAIRDVERRIQKTEAQSAQDLPVVDKPAGIPDDFTTHARLLLDLQLLAFQADLTRVFTLVLARTGALLVSPAVVLIVAFVLVPLGYAVYISLTNWPLLGPYHYVGLANYKQLVHDPQFLDSIRFTLIYTAIVTPAIFIVGYGLAVLLRANRPGSKIFLKRKS